MPVATMLRQPVAEEVLRQLQHRLSERILQPWLPDPTTAHPLSKEVVGIGIGPKFAGGQSTGQPALIFYVEEKRPGWQVEAKIPSEIEGVPTDVEESGALVAFAHHQARRRPAQPGCSIGTADGATTGTFGAVVFDTHGETYILGNNHVLADCDRYPVGGPIIQPGSLDTGQPEDDVVARLVRTWPLNPMAGNDLDCALARPVGDHLEAEILYIGRPQGVAEPTVDMPVHKTGRSTGYTRGYVRSVNTDFKIRYGDVFFKLTRQVAFKGENGQPFSDAGDSGALILDSRNDMAAAMLNGGTEQFTGPAHVTIGSGIARVLSAFGVQLA